MKKFLWSILCLFLLITHASAQEGKRLVLSSASMIHDMAKNIGGDHFAYEMIVPIGGDPHLHDPTPRDARVCNRADLILINGLTFEGWINDLIANAGTEAKVVVVTEGIHAIESEQYANASDPHAWMDASNGLLYVRNIRNAMLAMKPEAEEDFNANYARYKEEIEELDAYISERIASIPKNKRILITSHDAFQYFGRRYGIQLESILGVSTDADVQTSDIRRLNEVIQSTAVPAVFIESTINPKMLEQIARDNNIVIGGKLYADSLSDEDGPASTYLKMLKHDADVIYEGLMLERAVQPVGDNEDAPRMNWLWALLLAPIAMALLLLVIRTLR